MSIEAASLAVDPQALNALVLQLQGSLRAHDLLVQALRLQIAWRKRHRFGATFDQIARETPSRAIAAQ